MRCYKKLWDSGIGLSCWLTSLFTKRTQSSELAHQLFEADRCTILELGTSSMLRVRNVTELRQVLGRGLCL